LVVFIWPDSRGAGLGFHVLNVEVGFYVAEFAEEGEGIVVAGGLGGLGTDEEVFVGGAAKFESETALGTFAAEGEGGKGSDGGVVGIEKWRVRHEGYGEIMA
jgi:hypothetical protein